MNNLAYFFTLRLLSLSWLYEDFPLKKVIWVSLLRNSHNFLSAFGYIFKLLYNKAELESNLWLHNMPLFLKTVLIHVSEIFHVKFYLLKTSSHYKMKLEETNTYHLQNNIYFYILTLLHVYDI